MTPKEKAEELVFKFKPYVQFKMGVDPSYVTRMAKMCALVAVDEILSMGIMSDSGDWMMAKSYWQEVKQEIEKL